MLAYSCASKTLILLANSLVGQPWQKPNTQKALAQLLIKSELFSLELKSMYNYN